MTKLILTLILLITNFIQIAIASDFETNVLMDKTYVHDNSYCRMKSDVVEFEVRSFDKYTQPDDSEYGEHIFALHNEKRFLLPLNADNLSRFKIFKGDNSFCSKAFSLQTGPDTLAVFFLKDNRPLGNLLTVLFFNYKTNTSSILKTDFVTNRGIIRDGKFKFPSLLPHREVQMGKVKIDNLTYIFRDAEIINWVNFDGTQFQNDHDLTYEKFDWNKYFTKSEFEVASAWDSKTNQYNQKRYLIAINHLMKRRCIAFTGKPASEILAHEWKCR